MQKINDISLCCERFPLSTMVTGFKKWWRVVKITNYQIVGRHPKTRASSEFPSYACQIQKVLGNVQQTRRQEIITRGGGNIE